MGLLTDPTAGQGKFIENLLKHHNKLCVFMYLAGLVSFCALALKIVNATTYFSENALLPGLVKSQFHDDKLALRLYEELLDEMDKYDDSIPYPWLLAKFKQIGLDTYTHNFTLHSPLNSREKFSGKNVYGILRAAKASSTEALVLSVPYRPPISVHPPTAPSIAIMLAFAKYANKEKYWAKDIIFLITEHEQLGIQAWLEAYHGVTCGTEGALNHGDLKGRAGAIQAAINLELHSVKIGQMDIKIEGLNGQLPNLDLFNLASKMCVKEGLYHTFKNKGLVYYRDPVKETIYYLKNLLSMVASQSTGIPNGNHGLFHRFGIQALTMEGFEQSRAKGSSKVSLISIGRILEGTFRSLNNLLERFHQSFFFYLLASPDRYVSIGLYMPVIGLIAGALFVKACAIWFKFQRGLQPIKKNENIKSQKKQEHTEGIKIDKIIITFLLIHLYGVLIMNIPQHIRTYSDLYIFNTAECLFYTFAGLSVIFLMIPFFLPFRTCEKSMGILNMLALLELGTVLICVSMNNFSLALFCGALTVPFALSVRPSSCRYYSFLQRLLWLFLHPMNVLITVVMINTYIMFPGEKQFEILSRGLDACKQAITYSIVDSMVYGNWLFSVITSIFIPNWFCFWCVAFSCIENSKTDVSEEKKTS